MRFGPLFFFLCFSMCALAQSPLSDCGPADRSAQITTTKEAVTPPADKAMLFVVQRTIRGPYTFLLAIDGKWVGADRGRSFFAVPVEAGEHHACILAMTHPGHSSTFHSLSLQAGHNYYFEIEHDMAARVKARFILRELDPDEGPERIKKIRRLTATFVAH